MARLQETYAKEIAPALMKKFNYKSVMQIPKLDKVVINVGCGEARDNPKIMDAILSDLACDKLAPHGDFLARRMHKLDRLPYAVHARLPPFANRESGFNLWESDLPTNRC